MLRAIGICKTTQQATMTNNKRLLTQTRGDAMSRTRAHYTEYAGNDGYTTLILNTDCNCPIPTHCDCDNEQPSSDKSRSYVRGYS